MNPGDVRLPLGFAWPVQGTIVHSFGEAADGTWCDGLDILAENIEDAAHNTTRFVIMSRDAAQPERTPGVTWVTAFVFRVRNVPAALYKTMGGFATNGVNMTKLESYQIGGSFNATQFYAEVEGHPDDPAVQRALEELGFFSTHVHHLGVFPAHAYRSTVAPPR